MATSLASSQINRNFSAPKYSLSRLIKTKLSTGNEHCLETEVSADLELKFGKKKSDFLVPAEVLGLRTLSTDGSGGNLISSEQSNFAYLAPTPVSKVISLGGRLLTNLKDEYQINGSVEPFQAFWVSEGGQIQDSQPDVYKLALSPYKLVASSTMTVELWNQTTEFVDNFVSEGMAKALWAEIDKSVLVGNGVNQPLGLASRAGVNSIVLGVNGGQLHWNAIAELEKLVTVNNPNEKSLGYLINSDTASFLKKAEKVNGSGQFLLADQPLQPTDEFKVLNSRICGVSNNLPANLFKGTSTDLSMAVFGDWSTVVIGIYGAINLQVDPFSNGNFDLGLVTLRMMARVGVGFLNPALFTVVTDVKTS